jgi:hypothetical protein
MYSALSFPLREPLVSAGTAVSRDGDPAGSRRPPQTCPQVSEGWREVKPMARSAKKRRHRDGGRAAAGRWERWQLLATILRIVVEIVEPLLGDRWFGGGGSGRLP